MVVTSAKPISISWIVSSNSGNINLSEELNEEEIKVGKLGLSMCPGKNMAAARDGKSY